MLDELHTYRGRQGADVALLVRRVRERLSPERRPAVPSARRPRWRARDRGKAAREWSPRSPQLFSADVRPDNVITETLPRDTQPRLSAESVRADLAAAIEAGMAANISDEAYGSRASHLGRDGLGVTRNQRPSAN